MKHDRIEPHQTDTPIPHLSDEEIEARVFRNLEARQKAWEKEREGGVVILQYPDNRTIYRRLAAWWYLRFQRTDFPARKEYVVEVIEPAWTGHWATTKYL